MSVGLNCRSSNDFTDVESSEIAFSGDRKRKRIFRWSQMKTRFSLCGLRGDVLSMKLPLNGRQCEWPSYVVRSACFVG